jgi:hypothetical protein
VVKVAESKLLQQSVPALKGKALCINKRFTLSVGHDTVRAWLGQLPTFNSVTLRCPLL